MPIWAVEKQYYEMPELVGFQTMIILDPNGMNFDAGGVFSPDFWLLFKSGSSYCGTALLVLPQKSSWTVNSSRMQTEIWSEKQVKSGNEKLLSSISILLTTSSIIQFNK